MEYGVVFAKKYVLSTTGIRYYWRWYRSIWSGTAPLSNNLWTVNIDILSPLTSILATIAPPASGWVLR
jgi:hypothetical protein